MYALLLEFRHLDKCPELANVSARPSYLQSNSGNNPYSNCRWSSDEARSMKEMFEPRYPAHAYLDEARQSSLAKLNSTNCHCVQWAERRDLKPDVGS